MLDRLFVYLLALLLAFAPLEASASQGQLFSPTTGTVSGLSLTNSYNNALDALNTGNSGASPPNNQLSGTASVGNVWINTTSAPYPHQVYDGLQYVTPWWIDPVNHLPIVQVGGGTNTIPSGTTTDLCSVPQFALTVTGATAIASFGASCPAGVQKVLTFAGALTLAYNSTSLIIPGAANVSTSAGDTAVVMSLGGGNWRVVLYGPATGQALINAAIDVGAVEWTFSPNIPSSKYLWGYGQAVSRASYPALLAALTITQTVTLTNGSPVLTGFTDTTQINWQSSGASARIEGPGIPTGATVVSCTTGSCTMSVNATASTTVAVSIFNYGNGDGSTTFNLPDCRGNFLVGRNNMGGTGSPRLLSAYAGARPDALGAMIGSQIVGIAQSNLPNVNFTVSGITLNNGGIIGNINICDYAQVSTCYMGNGGFYGTGNANTASPLGAFGTNVNSNVTVNSVGGVQGIASSGGSGAPLAIVPPGLTANCMIRVLATVDPSGSFDASARTGFIGLVPARRRLAA